ncbi:PREDICTED: uncharacterized protein LOC103340529 [Prunus mume]|uniref:Uncharacterized protein LOC103340529 n=1 Tax=Prunus mume TaxID=102107 RepID=A0ABM1LR34_PRUMU|nr:PREDICTED: uncharacterized protein LOC103340529 [Prunus mume]XP_016649861.1 PREDICTED: uncharacterized protein LOC103340529 [Prunus mume]
MTLLRSPSGRDNQESAKKPSFPLADQLQKQKSPFGFYTDSDMLVWLKGLALDPCDRKASPDSARQLWKQSLKVRKLLLLGNVVCPRRKRKLHQFLNSSKFAGASGLATEQSYVHTVKKMGRVHSVSCVTNTNANSEIFEPLVLCNSRSSGSLLTFEDEDQHKPGYTDLAIMDVENIGPYCKDNSASPLIDTDESNNGLNTLSPKNLNFCDATNVNLNDTAESSDSSSLDENSSELECALRSLVSSDDYLPRSIPVREIDGSAHHSDPMRSKEQNSKVREAVKIMFSDGGVLRAVVPIGPGFQVEVPEWTGPVDRKNLYGSDGDSKVSRWLGTQTWPIKGKSAGTIVKELGKGRSDSCSCVSPGSVGCVKHHIHEARLCLQYEIGPAFRSWKFDEMGEFVSASWTSSEQRSFESLVRMNPLSNEASFWRTAFKRFPSKCRKSILNYYYNVFIPRRMSIQTRSSLNEIDSDDDQTKEEQLTGCKSRRVA